MKKRFCLSCAGYFDEPENNKCPHCGSNLIRKRTKPDKPVNREDRYEQHQAGTTYTSGFNESAGRD